jgi:hypothetical protein
MTLEALLAQMREGERICFEKQHGDVVLNVADVRFGRPIERYVVSEKLRAIEHELLANEIRAAFDQHRRIGGT